MPGEFLGVLGMDAAACQIRDERVPEGVEVEDPSGSIPIPQEGGFPDLPAVAAADTASSPR